MKLSSNDMGKIERKAGCGGGDQSILTKTFYKIEPDLRKKKEREELEQWNRLLLQGVLLFNKEIDETTTGVAM